MELLFAGTGAADFSPLLKTVFFNKLDLNARRCSSLLIDGKYLIDCGPHTLDALYILGVDTDRISDVFITHQHSDHCHIPSLISLSQSDKRIWSKTGKIGDMQNQYRITPYTPYEFNDMTLYGLEANHTEEPLHFYIENKDKKMFYGCDGAWMLTPTFYFLKNKKLDICILDGTVGDAVGDYRASEHNSLPMIRLLLPSMKTFGIITDETKVILSHIARTLTPPYKEYSESLSKENIILAYDGMYI